jgi:hypothetical protein
LILTKLTASKNHIKTSGSARPSYAKAIKINAILPTKKAFCSSLSGRPWCFDMRLRCDLTRHQFSILAVGVGVGRMTSRLVADIQFFR